MKSCNKSENMYNAILCKLKLFKIGKHFVVYIALNLKKRISKYIGTLEIYETIINFNGEYVTIVD